MSETQSSSPPQRPQASPFWSFSLRIYAKPGVPPACLALQEKSGVDVNVLLFCLYAAQCGRELAAADVEKIAAAVEPWKAGAVVTLRAARVYLRNPASIIDAQGAEALRQRVKALELEAERLQQEALYKTFPMGAIGASEPSAAMAARRNAAALETALGATFDKSALNVILGAFDSLGV